MLPDGVVFWELNDETPTGAERVAQIILETIKEAGKPECLLVDISAGGRGTKHENTTYSRFLKEHPLDAIAIYGMTPALRIVVNMVCIVAGFRQVHFYKTRAEALAALMVLRRQVT